MVASPVSHIDWGALAPLRLTTRQLAEGLYLGAHRSHRQGGGVEFGGHRAYVPGDDLRWLDQHALLRHDRLMIRQFERDSEHALHLVVDDTLSMAFRGDDSPHSKFAFAAALAASLGYVALRSGDRVALHWLGGRRASLQTSGVGSFDRLATALEEVEAAQTLEDAKQLEHALLPALKASQRGGIVVLLSDLIDWDEPWQEPLSWLAGGRRKLVLVRVSDRTEEDFSLDGAVQLEATEGKHRVLTEPRRVRTAYLESRHAHLESWRRFLVERGAALLTMVTDEPLTGATRRVLSAIAGAEAA